MSEIKRAPIDIQVGDQFKHPWGVFEVHNIRGAPDAERDNREWYVRDPETGEELWVDFDFFIEIMNANVSGSQFEG